jgi:hypothetical protein
MPVRTVGEYLRRWGFTPKVPRRHSRDQDPEEVRRWIDEECPCKWTRILTKLLNPNSYEPEVLPAGPFLTIALVLASDSALKPLALDPMAPPGSSSPVRPEPEPDDPLSQPGALHYRGRFTPPDRTP